jgi:O-antigen ligase
VKWVSLIILLGAMAPLCEWLRRNPDQAPRVWIVMGVMPFAFYSLHLNMAAISWPEWTGHVSGIEFSAVDALTLAFYFSLPRAQYPLPFRLSMALYFLTALLSTLQALVPLAALFYAWQLARMFLLYAVVTRACADPRVPYALLKGMAAGLIMEAGVVVWQRFGLGMLQATGTVGHQNLLGMISHFVVFPYFAQLLAGGRGRLPAAVVLAGVIVEVLTTSRATLGLAALGYATVFVLFALRRWTSSMVMVLALGIAAVTALAPLSLSSIERRGAAQLEASDDERKAFETASAMMLSDHPLGVGANNFVVTANVQGYYQAAGVTWRSSGATVHNIYWLIVAETGYPGLITFVFLLFQPLLVAFTCGWRNRGDERADLLLGFGVVLLVVYIHCFFEWIFITFQAQYLFAINIGLIAGLAAQLGYWGRPYGHGVGSLNVGHTKTPMDEERRLIRLLRKTGNPTERRLILDSIIGVRHGIFQARKGTQSLEQLTKGRHDP